MGVHIVPILELTRLACCEVVGESHFEMPHQSKTGTEVDAQVGIFQTILAKLGLKDLVGHGETELRTCCEIEPWDASRTAAALRSS